LKSFQEADRKLDNIDDILYNILIQSLACSLFILKKKEGGSSANRAVLSPQKKFSNRRAHLSGGRTRYGRLAKTA
jgi:hypothetical protein